MVSEKINSKAFKIGIPSWSEYTTALSGLRIYTAGPFDNPRNSVAQEHIIKVLNWNIEGIRGALNLTDENILSRYDICTLTKTFMRKETAISNPKFYNFHVYAKQTRERGRPSGGITCLIKPHLAPFEVLLKEEDLITVQTRNGAIIAAFFNPDRFAVDIVDSLSKAISALQRKQKIILAGDFNCTIDKIRGKTDEVPEFLHMEGLVLQNQRNEWTYIAPNGGSTIDLVLTRGFQTRGPARPLNSAGAIIRKHIPMCLDVIQNTREAKQSNVRKRLGKKIDTDALHRHRNQLNRIRKGLDKGKIEDAAHWIQTCKEDAPKPGPEGRQAKPWFDQECYHR